MKKFLVGLGIVLAVVLAIVVLVPGYHFVLLGKLKNERFYEDRPVSYWLNALSSREDSAREHAAYVLGQMGTENSAVIPALVAALKDEDYIVRKNAATALGE